MSDGSYSDYARTVLAAYERTPASARNALFEAVKTLKPLRVLDLGCGPGQELRPFAANSEALCIGIDVGEELGTIAPEFFRRSGFKRVFFARARGEELPFANSSFDVVLCRVALPYMDNRAAIAEVARVLAPDGVFLLKTHAPPFYLAMLRERVRTLNPKQLAYPIMCLVASVWHSLTGGQLMSGIFTGKEIFQTRRFVERELQLHGLRIVAELDDTNPQTPSYRIERVG
jgi:SAM-dependent methyltransferase